MSWSKALADYFSFTRKDSIGILVILAIVIGVFFLPKTFKAAPKPVPADTAWVTAMKNLEQKELANENRSYTDDNSPNYQYDRATNHYTAKANGELFNFDPNTLSAEGWAKLGIRQKTIQTIQNYLTKGGKFRKPEDLQRIYGLFPNEFERIAPYIKIEAAANTTGYTAKSDYSTTSNQPTKTYGPRYSIVDINSTDTTALIALPGIGSKLASRIINFRDKLGGFYSVTQVGETFGLPDSTFQKIKQYLKAEANSIKKINVNTASVDELKTHPYIKWSIANPLVAYRKEHGPFTKLEEIKKVMAVTDEVYIKIAPYLTTD